MKIEPLPDVCGSERRKRIQHVCIKALKFSPILLALLMAIHSVSMYCGYDNEGIAEAVGLVVVSALVLMMSFAFGFCLAHQALIVYSIIVSSCIYYHRHFGFSPDTAHTLQLTMTIVGLLLIVLTTIYILLKDGRTPKK